MESFSMDNLEANKIRSVPPEDRVRERLVFGMIDGGVQGFGPLTEWATVRDIVEEGTNFEMLNEARKENVQLSSRCERDKECFCKTIKQFQDR